MAITIDWTNKVIESTLSITDLPAFHATLRDLEDDPTGMIYLTTHTWKALDLGGGAFFYQCDLINGYQLKFPIAGNYTIVGNLNGTIIPVAGVYVERKTSAAFITTAVGGSGPTAGDIAAAILAAAQTTPIHSNMKQTNGVAIKGDGTENDKFRSVLVP
jgi:hypothetical protein